jgi:hypothetical protein
MHMSMCRLVRPSNGFNKKLENQTAALALCCMHYNFVRIRQTLRVTPATATGVIKKLWKVPDIMALLNREYHLTHYRPMNSTGRPPAETANHHPARAGGGSTGTTENSPPTSERFAGTSASAPSLAGVVALLNQFQVVNDFQKQPRLGNTPGVVGLTQVNLIVPRSVTAGIQPVVVTVGGVSSPTAYMIVP